MFINETVSVYNNNLEQFLSFVYPIGSILEMTNTVNPSTLFPNTKWEQIEGKFLLSSDSSHALESTGGEAVHTLTVNEIPSHSHTITHEHTTKAETKYTTSSGAHTHEINQCRTTGSNTLYISGNEITFGTSTSGGFYSSASVSLRLYPPALATASDSHTHTSVSKTATSNSVALTVASAGSGLSHNNMPPYIAVNTWKRIA